MSLLPQGFTANVGTSVQSVSFAGVEPVIVSSGPDGLLLSNAATLNFVITPLAASFTTSAVASGSLPYNASLKIFEQTYAPSPSNATVRVRIHTSYVVNGSVSANVGIVLGLYTSNVAGTKPVFSIPHVPYIQAGQGGLSFFSEYIYNPSAGTLPDTVTFYVCAFSYTGVPIMILANSPSYFAGNVGTYLTINSLI